MAAVEQEHCGLLCSESAGRNRQASDRLDHGRRGEHERERNVQAESLRTEIECDYGDQVIGQLCTHDDRDITQVDLPVCLVDAEGPHAIEHANVGSASAKNQEVDKEREHDRDCNGTGGARFWRRRDQRQADGREPCKDNRVDRLIEGDRAGALEQRDVLDRAQSPDQCSLPETEMDRRQQVGQAAERARLPPGNRRVEARKDIGVRPGFDQEPAEDRAEYDGNDDLDAGAQECGPRLTDRNDSEDVAPDCDRNDPGQTSSDEDRAGHLPSIACPRRLGEPSGGGRRPGISCLLTNFLAFAWETLPGSMRMMRTRAGRERSWARQKVGRRAVHSRICVCSI